MSSQPICKINDVSSIICKVENCTNDSNIELNQCLVPQCSNNSKSNPNKVFVCVPEQVETRKKWLHLARKSCTGNIETNPIFFCEDHFDVSEDMANYFEYKILGIAKEIIMKPDCLPSKFNWSIDTVPDLDEECVISFGNRKNNCPVIIMNSDESSNDVETVKNFPQDTNLLDKHKAPGAPEESISNIGNRENNCPSFIMNSDESSNDVETVKNFTRDSNFLSKNEARPIMLLFERLIGNDNKQNTVLTNAQIIEILQNEFQIHINGLHELELDIYLTVTKKFLKDWPQWDDFDRIVNGLKSVGAYESIQKILNKKYKHLKDYLQVMIQETQKLTETVMAEVAPEENSPDDVVMEICCTRSQLNQLIFRRPHPDFNNTIFNLTIPTSPSKIILHSLNIETILNWWNIKININLNVFAYTRQTVHVAKHMLINNVRKRPWNEQNELPQELLMKNMKMMATTCKISNVTVLLDKILLLYINKIEVYYLIETIFNLLKDDLKDAGTEIVLGAMYRKFSSKYKYKRYLNADSFCKMSDKTKYDLHLEETVSPMHEFCIGKVDTLNSLLPPFSEWFNIECVMCNKKFSGVKLMDSFKVHFNENHMNEPDWKCTNCLKVFNMAELAEKKWFHTCLS